MAEQKPTIDYPHLFAGPDGESLLESIAVELRGDGPWRSRSIPAGNLSFMRMPAGYFGDWHRAPRRQFLITLSGGARLVTSSGAEHTVGPGTAMLLEDIAGKGHQTIVGLERVAMVVSLAGEAVPAVRPAANPLEPGIAGPVAPAPLRFPRVYLTPDGETHLDEVEAPVHGNGPWSTDPSAAVDITFIRMPAGVFADWHIERCRLWVVTLAGGADIIVSDGANYRVGPGTAMLFEDTSGRGHQTRVLEGEDRVVMIIALAE